MTAATAYGESEPSAPQTVPVLPDGSVTLTWPEATNGFSTDGTARARRWRRRRPATPAAPGSGVTTSTGRTRAPRTYGLVGQVAENPSATSGTTYSFTDTGATTPGAAPNSGPDFPTATNPGIDCAAAAGSWLPASSTQPDSSIEQEIGLDQAFAAANGLTNYTPAAVVTGEHSGVENPNMPAALAGAGVTTFAAGRLPAAAAVLARAAPSAHPATRATSTTTRRTGPTS